MSPVDLTTLYLDQTSWFEEARSEPLPAFVMPPPQIVIPAASAAKEVAKKAVRTPIAAPATSALALGAFLTPGVYCELANPYACHAPVIDKGMVFTFRGPVLGKNSVHYETPQNLEIDLGVCELESHNTETSELGFSPYQEQEIDLENTPTVVVDPEEQHKKPGEPVLPLVIPPKPHAEPEEPEIEGLRMSAGDDENISETAEAILEEAGFTEDEPDYPEIKKILILCMQAGEKPNVALEMCLYYDLGEIEITNDVVQYIGHNAEKRREFINALEKCGFIDASSIIGTGQDYTRPDLLTWQEARYLAEYLYPLLPAEKKRVANLDLTWRKLEKMYRDIVTGHARIIPDDLAHRALARILNEETLEAETGHALRHDIPGGLKDNANWVARLLDEAFHDERIAPIINTTWPRLNAEAKDRLVDEYALLVSTIQNVTGHINENILGIIFRLELIKNYFKGDDIFGQDQNFKSVKDVVDETLRAFYEGNDEALEVRPSKLAKKPSFPGMAALNERSRAPELNNIHNQRLSDKKIYSTTEIERMSGEALDDYYRWLLLALKLTIMDMSESTSTDRHDALYLILQIERLPKNSDNQRHLALRNTILAYGLILHILLFIPESKN
ncbi:hypothetical protein K1X76_00110 [bacterium]|nr:hypothetical protein [bacterium]